MAEARSIQRFEGSCFCSRRTQWDFNRLWLESCWNEEYLWDDRQSGAQIFSHYAKAPDDLIVTRDTSFFKAYWYLQTNERWSAETGPMTHVTWRRRGERVKCLILLAVLVLRVRYSRKKIAK